MRTKARGVKGRRGGAVSGVAAAATLALLVAACVPGPPAPGTTTTTRAVTPSVVPKCGALRTWPAARGISGSATPVAPLAAAEQARAAATVAIANPRIPGDERSVPIVVTTVDAQGTPQSRQVNSDDPTDAASDVESLARRVDASGGDVVAVESPRALHVEATATDPGRANQWALDQLDFEAVWTASPSGNGKGACVAVVDTGIQANHPDLAGQVVGATDFTGEGTADGYGHGTHVAGIIAAVANNYAGVAGAAPGSKVLNVKVLNSSGSGWDFWTANGIVWAVDHGAQVVNLSLASGCLEIFTSVCATQAMQGAIGYAQAHDVMVVAAAGNDGADSGLISWPAAFPYAIAVAATTSTRALADFSSRGAYVDVAAPGDHILSTYAGSEYAYWGGTSMAAPYVSALAAVLRATHPTESAAQIRVRIETRATDLGPAGWDQGFGWGLVNPGASNTP